MSGKPELLFQPPPGEAIVALTQFRGRFFMATTYGLWEIKEDDVTGVSIAKLEITNQADIYRDVVRRINDYDRREAAGEDMSQEVRPRLPGASDW